MPDAYLRSICVRPIGAGERRRFDEELDRHHWLGHNLVGETMRHVAIGPDGVWVALVGFGAAALACRPREELIGWSDDQRFRRLRYVVNNQRYCVLGDHRRKNLASAVLARSLRRLSDDYRSRWGHPVVAVETFVDPERHVGTCYLVSGFSAAGETSGFGRSGSRKGGRYLRHGNPKLYLARPLRSDAYAILAGDFDHPLLEGSDHVIDLNALDFDGSGGLLGALEEMTDHRKRRGVRHPLSSILAIATAAALAGSKSMVAIGEYAADLPQEVLRRLGAKYHPDLGRYIAPSDETFRRVLKDHVDAAELDQVVGSWLFSQLQAGNLAAERLVLALDGKSLRGALRADGRAVHLFSAMVHGTGVVVAQEEVDEKSNEITALRPLFEDIDITGALVTADALHCQDDHARFIVEEKHADYLLQVKDNRPKLLAAIKAIPAEDFSKEYETTDRGHGRTEHRYYKVADAPEGLPFPHAAQVVVAYRERGDLADLMTSADTSYYVTSVTKAKAGPERLGGHVRGHWGIESLHWIRDWCFDEDRHQLRSDNVPRVMATLRNLAIALLRLAGAVKITATTRWVGRDATRAAALLGV